MTCRSLICLFLIFAACTQAQEDESALNWGHLPANELRPDAPGFLINHPRGEVFKVCLANEMVAALPGIKQEAEAAINIWGHYIGRQIPIEFIQLDLPRLVSMDSASAQHDTYRRLCGKADVMMAMKPLDGNTIGQTERAFSFIPDKNGDIERFSGFNRFLYLRDFKSSPMQQGSSSKWETFAQRFGEKNSENLLSFMKSRAYRDYQPKRMNLTLPTLVHEFGHVWGLCDQYEGPKNCDVKFSSGQIVHDALMGNEAPRPLFLLDDDIEGIRKLALRDGFNHGWAGASVINSIAIPSRIFQEVEAFTLENIKYSKENVFVSYSAVTNVPSRLTFSLREKGSNQWVNFNPYFTSQGFKEIHSGMVLTLHGVSDHLKYEVRATLETLDSQNRVMQTKVLN